MLEINKIYNMDCLDGLKLLPNKSIDLCLTDPPYSIIQNQTVTGGGGNASARIWPLITWDVKPSAEIIKEILRVSKNAVIFGAEHLSDILPQRRGWIVWDKMRNENLTFSDAELIWTSFDRPVKIIRLLWDGFMKDYDTAETIKHPAQKPIKLIRKLIEDYSSPGDLILDAYSGAGTVALACKQLNRNYIGFEIQKNYIEIAEERLKQKILSDF